MSLRKPPALTPGLLAANARNAQKSTGPRTPRGKAFSSSNGWKGGRPSRSKYPFPVSAEWEPDMSDPNFVGWMLSDMRQNYPEAYAIWMRCEAKQGQFLLGKEVDSGRSKKGGPQKFKIPNKIILITNDIPGSVLETNLPITAK